MSDTQHPSLLRRFVTISYDLLLLIAVSMYYVLVYISVNKLILGSKDDNAEGLLLQIGWLLTIFTFFCYFWIRGGQTTGMRAWRVQITNLDGDPPSISQCIVRFLLAIVGWLLFFTGLFHPQNKMLHDSWSKTQLIVLDKHHK